MGSLVEGEGTGALALRPLRRFNERARARCRAGRELIVDGDLAEAVNEFKAIIEKRGFAASWSKAPADLVATLKKELRVPSRFRNFLLSANPTNVESVTPIEKVRFLPAEELLAAQKTVREGVDGATPPLGWNSSWVMVGESSLLGDPYFLDVSKPDAEGDCPVYTAMAGQDRWQPTLAASSFAQFLRILTMAMEMAGGFGDAIMDDEDEDNFREALGPKIKVIDPAALRAGHWT